MTKWNSLLSIPWGPGKVAPDRWRDLWNLLPPHPGKAHKAGNGRPSGNPAIRSLFAADDAHVFIGHGDGNANDGSTLLVSLDPASGTYTAHGVHNTEELSVFRRAPDGSVWAPYIDPTGYWEPAPPAAVWPARALGMIDAIHVFDLLHHDGRIWYAGSTHAPGGSGQAAVWYSDDGGATHVKTLPTGAAGDYERVYHLGVAHDGRVIAEVNTTSVGLEWYAWTGLAWEKTQAPPPPPAPPAPPQPAPPHVSSARTSTHWVLGTAAGDLYTLPAV